MSRHKNNSDSDSEPCYPKEHWQLLGLMAEDQVDRLDIDINSKAAWTRLQKRDKKRLQTMLELLARFKQPTVENIGQDGSKAVWLLAQHSDLVTMQHILRLFVRLHRQNKPIYHQGIPYLKDRINILQNKKQHYGTQFLIDEKGDWQLRPLVSKKYVNKWRAEFDLEPLAEALISGSSKQ